MSPLYRRIAIHGALTAIILAILGFMFVELAGMWLQSNAPVRGGDGEMFVDDKPVVETMRARVPFLMALWGFVFVVIGEIVMHIRRGEPKPVPVVQDEGEKLLEELLQQAEAAKQVSGEKNLDSPSVEIQRKTAEE
jgi:hypothetical protein